MQGLNLRSKFTQLIKCVQSDKQMKNMRNKLSYTVSKNYPQFKLSVQAPNFYFLDQKAEAHQINFHKKKKKKN